MSYTIAEVSKLINLSKVSIYRKLKLKEVKEHTSKKQGITYIDEEGFNLIKYGIKNEKDEFKYTLKQNPISSEIAIDVNLNKEMINLLKDQLKEKDKQLTEKDLHFNNQLNVKDLQINNLNERLKQSLELNRNSQVLLKDKPHEDILLLEEHFQNLDDKLEEVKNKMLDRKEQQEKKSFLTRIFKSKV